MPKRTNDFQSLIALIERQLAPEGAQVTESKLLKDILTGEEREVDTVIETKVSGHTITIGIECRDRDRRADVEWIDQLLGKYQNLPVHKIIAVSRSGFTQGALEKARGSNIQTLTLEEAAVANWEAVVKQLKTVKVESILLPYPVKVNINFAKGVDLPAQEQIDLPRAVVYDSAGTAQSDLGKIVDSLVAHKDVVQDVQKEAFANSDVTIDLKFRLPEGCYIKDTAGLTHPVRSIFVKAKCRKEISAVLLQHCKYESAQVAFGSGSAFGHTFTFAFVEQQGKNPTAGVTIRKL